MTFMCDVWSSSETQARKASEDLCLWLRTISPASSDISDRVVSSLLLLAEEMKWSIQDDEYLGRVVMSKDNN